jgi:hypothetical protein
MIDEESLAGIGFDATLPADTPARLALPPDAEGQTWWKIGSTTWLRALPAKSVLVHKPDQSRSVEARFRSDYPGIAVDEDAEWVSGSLALQGLADDLVAGLKRQLAASVPLLPTRSAVLPPSELQLVWPDTGAGDPVIRRHRRLAGLEALTSYTERADAELETDPDPKGEDLSARLLRHLSAIPRPAEARVHLAAQDRGALVLSWDQVGNPDLLWGNSALSWHEPSRSVQLSPLSPGDAEEDRKFGACAHLLAMATAVEGAMGGCSVPMQLCYRSVFDHTITAMLTISSEQWAFYLAVAVHELSKGHLPEDFRLNIEN